MLQPLTPWLTSDNIIRSLSASVSPPFIFIRFLSRHFIAYLRPTVANGYNLAAVKLHETNQKKHTHTHPFNGPFSGTTRVSRYQKGKTNLDFTEARDSQWQWH